jgi:parvulin-like peptidyl-prolyl isomerase
MLSAWLVACKAAGPAPATPTAGATPTEPPAAAVPTAPAVQPGEVAARVNGQPILRQDFEMQVIRFEAAMVSQGMSFSGQEGAVNAQQVRKQVLESMIDEALIAQAAAAEGITVSPEVLQQRIASEIQAGGGEAKFNQWLETNHMTRQEYEAAMRSQIITDEIVRRLGTKIPETMKQVHIRQILVENEADAKSIRRQLDAGAKFDDLARKFSRDEATRDQGGDRGFLPLGTSILGPEIEKALQGLQPGQIAGPIASPYGYYLIQLVEVDENRALSPEQRQGLMRDAFVDWIEEQRSKAAIERFVDVD